LKQNILRTKIATPSLPDCCLRLQLTCSQTSNDMNLVFTVVTWLSGTAGRLSQCKCIQ